MKAPPLIARLEASRSYGLLLGLIVVSLAFQLATPDTRAARLIVVGLQAATLLLALWTSRTKEKEFRLALIGIGVAILASALLASSDRSDVARGGLNAVGALVVLVGPVVVARGVFTGIVARHAVTLSAAFGVICVYLLVGMLFGYAYGLVAVLQDSALFANGTDGSLQEHLYFSFTTLTTTGLGDLTPAGDVARALTIFEALLGQLYLVTVVAVIVSNLGRERRR